MRVLVAEDDAALAGFLRRSLESDGYQVQIAADGEAALGALLAQAPDLAILDLNMPHMDGKEVLRLLRTSGASFPVLVLTGQVDLETRLACLALGADDCMLKPFSLQELRARLSALLRRNAQEAVVQLGDLRLDRLERVVERGGRRIPLTNREYALLEQLVLERGGCLARSVLLKRVWGLSSSATNVLDVYINYLRRKLDDRGRVSLIETVRGRGYRIALRPAITMAIAPGSEQGRPATLMARAAR